MMECCLTHSWADPGRSVCFQAPRKNCNYIIIEARPTYIFLLIFVQKNRRMEKWQNAKQINKEKQFTNDNH